MRGRIIPMCPVTLTVLKLTGERTRRKVGTPGKSLFAVAPKLAPHFERNELREVLAMRGQFRRADPFGFAALPRADKRFEVEWVNDWRPSVEEFYDNVKAAA